MGNETTIGIASAGAAGHLIVLANAAGAADAPRLLAYPLVLKSSTEHRNAIDPPPFRSANDPLDLVLGGRKRGPLHLQQDELSKRTVPLGLCRRVLRKDPGLTDGRRLAPWVDVRDQPSLERRTLRATHRSPLSAQDEQLDVPRLGGVHTAVLARVALRLEAEEDAVDGAAPLEPIDDEGAARGAIDVFYGVGRRMSTRARLGGHGRVPLGNRRSSRVA
jgi:hypothetical protein